MDISCKQFEHFILIVIIVLLISFLFFMGCIFYKLKTSKGDCKDIDYNYKVVIPAPFIMPIN